MMSKEEFYKLLLELNVGTKEFFQFLEGKVYSYPLGVQEFGWSVFPKVDENNRIVDIRILVPCIVDEATICVNIHEFTHAFEYYQHLNEAYIEDVKESEQMAVAKEIEYMNLKRNKLD